MTNIIRRATWTYFLSFAAVVAMGAVAILMTPKRYGLISPTYDAGSHAAFDGVLPQDPLTLYTSEWNIYQTIFKEPFETAVFLFKDGTVLAYSTHEANRVGVSPSLIVDNITKSGKRLTECLRIVHNHFGPSGFTEADQATYRFLKEKGFKGIFGIYHTSTGVFESIE